MLENKIPPPIIALASALLMWGISANSPNIALSTYVSMSLIIIILVSGLFFVLSGLVLFRRAKTTIDPMKPESATSLVSTGIYRISRNPMYLGLLLLLLVFFLYLAAPFSVIGIIAFVLYINEFQIKPEERALQKKFGIAFTEYKSKVGRWL